MITYEMLNTGQREIFDDIIPKLQSALKYGGSLDLSERMFSIAGQSGSGKSTLTSVILNEIANSCDIVMTTPTHKALEVLRNMVASLNAEVEAKTIHSHLGLKVQENYNTGKYELVQDSKRNFISPADILFIDEASMISEELFTFIENELVVDNVKAVVFIGDKNQLLPVEGGNNPIYEDYLCQSYELTEVTRQAAESDIIKMATKLRECISSGEYAPLSTVKDWLRELEGAEIEINNNQQKWLEDYFINPNGFENNLIVSFKNVTVDRYNKLAREKDIGKGVDYLIPDETLIFQEAHIVNDEYIHRNNEVVEISKCEQEYDEALDLFFWRVVDTENRPFRVVDGKSKMDYEYELSEIVKIAKRASGVDRSNAWRRFFEIKASFQNVSYKYACTAYKSQGSTCTDVYLDANEMFAMERVIGIENVYRSLYVAMTRAKEKAIFHLR